MASRPKKFKTSSTSVEELRKKRGEEGVELRKSKRDEEFLKRRNLSSTLASMPVDNGSACDNGDQLRQSEAMDTEDQLIALDFPAICADLTSGDEARQLNAAHRCRLSVTAKSTDGIEALAAGNSLPIAVHLLAQPQTSPQLMMELVWILTNVAAGSSEHTATVVSAGAVPVLIHILSVDPQHSAAAMLVEQALWALGNIAGDNSNEFLFRNMLLVAGLAPAVVSAVSNFYLYPSLVNNATWVTANVCRAPKSIPDTNTIKPLLPLLVELLRYNKDDDVMKRSCRVIAGLTAAKSLGMTEDLLRIGVGAPLVEQLAHRSVAVVDQAVRSLGNLLSGDDAQTQVLIDAGIVPALRPLLSCDNYHICKDTLRAVGNITAGNREQVEALVNAGIFPKLVKLLHQLDTTVVMEALLAISNITLGGNREHMDLLVSLNCHTPLAGILQSPSPDLVCIALNVLQRFLKLDVLKARTPDCENGTFTGSFVESGGVDALWKLVNSQNDTISELADQLLTKYFSNDDL